MKRSLFTTGGAAAVAVAILAFSSAATGSTTSTTSTPAVAAKTSTVVITERGAERANADKTFRGRFIIVLDGVKQDAGTTSILNFLGTSAKVVDGQTQEQVSGYDNLTGSKGTLSLSYEGVNITIGNFDPLKDAFYIEYGTWKVNGATGIYKGWKGGGRWASTGPTAHNFEWVGNVTH